MTMFTEDIKLGDTAILFKDCIDDAELLVSWKDIEFCINNPWQYGPSIIHKTLARKLPLKFNESFWFGKDIANKQQVIDYVKQGHTLVLENFSVHSAATHSVCKKIEDMLDVTVDMHVHCSLGKAASYPIHCDLADNFILQVAGETLWRVYSAQGDPTGISSVTNESNAGTIVIDTVLRPGDVLFIPAKTYHQATPFEKRISISIPCSKNGTPIDRRNLKLL